MTPDYPGILAAVARDIAALKDQFPQLAEFSADKTDVDDFRISYDYHTHAPTHRGGWTSGVPNPDQDGVWFHLDFHDPDSMAQIHTQPVVPMGRLGTKVVMLLILEGRKTKPLAGKLWEILRLYGVKLP